MLDIIPSFKAILFDLDGTLLDHNMMEDFLPPYLAALSASVARYVPPQRLVEGIMAGSAAITANDGTRTNEEVFAETFYPYVGVPREDLEPAIMNFYIHDFPQLQRYTRRKLEARRVMQTAFDLGYDVVIATNPYFPAIAVQHRLTWAGVEDFPYHKVTTYENSHFAKPDVRYFEEILCELDCPSEAALVVGDETMDMVAAQLGCLTFLVTSSATQLDDSTPPPTYQGTLADVAALLLRIKM
ncbi:MAG: HAD family hydrolase [Anaerolineae bacterium]|nr:HAD family hydrolase [Anaerolineae bacterium]